MSYLSVEYEDGIAVVTLDQDGEKVNKLNEQLIEEFTALLDKFENQKDLKGAVLVSGKEGNFIAGADVEMLKNKQAPDEIEELSRTGNKLLLRLENFEKPVVAAIHGSCMGGGLELTMACHYRVASNHSDTVMAQPEVKLGLCPGAGGTQRLPRLIGLQKSLTYLLTGKNIYPRQASKMGLVDELTHRDAILTAAKKAIAKINNGSFSRKDKRSILEKLLESNPPGRKIIFSQARKRALSNTKGNYPAPPAILECVEEGYSNGLEVGLERESKAFGELAATLESKNLVNLFFGMQSAKKNPQQKKARDISKVGVLGAGLMGAGIADVSVNNGLHVLLKDQTVEQAAKGKKTIWDNMQDKVDKRIISEFERDRTSSLVTPTGSYDGFENVDMVIEAVFEELDLKQKMVKQVEEVTPDHCIFASNTSSLPITQIAEASFRPEQVVGMHYFSPVQKMPLVEIIKTEQTSDWVTATAREIGVRQGKHVIVVNDGPGFYTTRILAPYMNEALALLEEGVSIEQLDSAMKQFGFPVGPAALFDEVGIDVAAHITDVLNELFADRGVEPSNKPKELLEAGYKGRKNKKGFYKYEESDGKKKKKEPNEAIYSYFGGASRKKMNDETIQQRMVLTMVNEAAWCLQEEILEDPADGDLGAILGLGYPPFLGGPFRYVDQQGVADIVSRMKKYQNELGIRFQPAEILKSYASEGKSFY
ncbi:fatty acid oxidation complex subunit alpha FadJ [Aliifodinibius sp. S!AR15-10]|uniref:fatty acid oxidation complex subunit alpha FadJ n=1 Tax=Aliifodinibius sp. S!AR15-10 TaxID=2950437 RepID=UPI00285AB0AF|nr:fatty acid oxidation complex subunit alpha FadJ [Aliifodinibius sp. S!AR15-10]MDR8390672.1 fatty acid oxidation complex subunit alpha FadJ [Aliifodinibius sp. S!AR15-10]